VGVEGADDDAATAAGDACELSDRGGRVGDELDHGDGERDIERIVWEGEVLDGGSDAAAGRSGAAQAERAGNDEFHTTFAGRRHDELDIPITVDRSRQLDAIRCHRSQSTDNPVLWRRLDLLGPSEHLRTLT
jgi:hypothetical protein